MCHKSVLDWIPKALTPAEVGAAEVLEVGSYDVNGSVRPIITGMYPHPDDYVGVDIEMGPGVDKVVRADELVATFGANSFDIVISTEMMEHVVEWQVPIAEMIDVLRPLGILIITTRGPGFPYHPYPIDTWRYTIDIMTRIMTAAGMEIMSIVDDPEAPGVFVKVSKPASWVAPWTDKPLSEVFADAGVLQMTPHGVR